MYRQYENPNELKEYLEDLKIAYFIMSAEIKLGVLRWTLGGIERPSQ